MFELKMWDTQMRVVCEIAKTLADVQGIHNIKTHNANTPCVSAELDDGGKTVIMIHVYKRLYQIHLSGHHNDIKVHHHSPDNVITTIIDQLNTMLSNPPTKETPL